MADAESPERLPIGWTEQVGFRNGEEVKFYYNVITGQKFYSKGDLIRYVELGSPSQGTRQQTRAQNEGHSENNLMLMPAETNKTPDWLPQGWIVELNATSNGRKYKRYIDPSTGRKFNSKPEILKYLNPGNSCTPQQTAVNTGSDSSPHMSELGGAVTPPKPEGSQNLETPKGTSSISGQKPRRPSKPRPKKVEILRFTAEGLPAGWIKEIKIERMGDKTRKDPYYTDPVSGYVFRSYKDALRYVETRDFSACATKPRKREELKFLSEDISITEEKHSLDNATQECAGKEESQAPSAEKEESHAPSSSPPQKTPGSKRKRGKSGTVSAPPTEIMREERSTASDAIKSEEKKVPSSPCRSSKRIAGTKPEREANPSVQVTEAAARDNGVGTEKKGEENLASQSLQRLGGSSLDPCLEFAFKTLRGDIPVEANLAVQGYNNQQRAPVNVGLPGFSDYARRQL